MKLEKKKRRWNYSFFNSFICWNWCCGSCSRGAAGIATSVNNKAANDARLKQQKEHDARIEAALKGNGLFLPEYEKGNGFSDGVKAFVEKQD